MRAEHVLDVAPAAGTVTVSVRVAVSAKRAFAALTEPPLVSQWFGGLRAALHTGGTSRLDFGDGDFFTITGVEVDPPVRVAWRWQFLGLMPADEVSWTIRPSGRGSVVTVTDFDPLRSAPECEMLRQGWVDFTARLAEFLATGGVTRYDWRRTFDGGVELPVAPAAALRVATEPQGARLWLPLTSALESGAELVLDDGIEPRSVTVGEVAREAGIVRLSLGSPLWLAATTCVLAVQQRGAGALLTVSHEGWEAIAASDEVQRRQRQRFAGFWIGWLRRLLDRFSKP